jgi:hypothetical protein
LIRATWSGGSARIVAAAGWDRCMGRAMRYSNHWRRGLGAAVVLVIAAAGLSGPAWAAGGAYAVDVADVAMPGACKVESWGSWASNSDFVGIGNPSCVVDLGRPVELSTQISRTRTDGEWAAAAAPKFKTNLIPTAIGSFGLAIAGGTSFDLTTHDNTGMFAVLPATLRMSHDFRISLNAGWQWDRILDRHYATYGAGFDWRTSDNVYTWTAEVFGQIGSSDVAGVIQPRFQTGFRYRPVDVFSVDIIYGRNITGENAHWITVGTILRIPPHGGADIRNY